MMRTPGWVKNRKEAEIKYEKGKGGVGSMVIKRAENIREYKLKGGCRKSLGEKKVKNR